MNFMSETSKKQHCHYLRGKNAYGTLEGGGNPFLGFDPGTSTYWCICTMSPIGPDGQPAHTTSCYGKERKCYEPPRPDSL
jgi:hypothetical protein